MDEDVGRDEVAPAVGVRGSALSLSSGLSQELNPGQTVPNGRCYHYTTKPRGAIFTSGPTTNGQYGIRTHDLSLAKRSLSR